MLVTNKCKQPDGAVQDLSEVVGDHLKAYKFEQMPTS